jgi:hypothetical protein
MRGTRKQRVPRFLSSKMEYTMIRKIFAASLLALLSNHSALADTWYVNVDTSMLSGQSGWLDFQFNPADASAPAASATILSFSSTGLMQPMPTATGDVSGSLDSTLVLGNSQDFNDWVQGITFGTALSFRVDLNVPTPNASGSGSAFSLSLYDSSYNSLLADPVWGAALVINASDDGTMAVLAQSAPVSLMTSPVPEPQNALLLLSGLGLIGWRLRKLDQALPLRVAPPTP